MANEDGLRDVSALVRKANRRKLLKAGDSKANRKKKIEIFFTVEEHELIKEVAELMDRSMRSMCLTVVLEHVIRYKEAALDDYENETRSRARRGVRPQAPIIPTDRIVG